MLGYARSSEVGGILCEIGEQFKDQLNQYIVAHRLWHYFLAFTGRLILQMNILSENGVNLPLHTENREFGQYFAQSLQLDVATIRLVHDSAHLP